MGSPLVGLLGDVGPQLVGWWLWSWGSLFGCGKVVFVVCCGKPLGVSVEVAEWAERIRRGFEGSAAGGASSVERWVAAVYAVGLEVVGERRDAVAGDVFGRVCIAGMNVVWEWSLARRRGLLGVGSALGEAAHVEGCLVVDALAQLSVCWRLVHRPVESVESAAGAAGGIVALAGLQA